MGEPSDRSKRGLAPSPRGLRARVFVVLGLAVLSGTSAALAQSLRGRVLDDSTGAGLAGARVDLLGQDGHLVQQVLTDQDGTFHVPVPGMGKYRVRARRLGYAPRSTPLIDLTARDTLAIALRLTTSALMLAPVTVVARRGVTVFNPYLQTEGYYDRKAIYGRKGLGVGTFLDGDKLRLAASQPGDLLSAVPGLRLRDYFDPRTGARTVMIGGRVCYPSIFVDGTFVGTGDQVGAPNDKRPALQDVLPPATAVAAVEVYPGTTAPMRYMRFGWEGCGVVAIWTGMRQ